MIKIIKVPVLLAFLFFLVVPDAFAAKADTIVDKTKAPVIFQALIDFDASEIQLTGFNFLQDTDDPVVAFGEDPTPLTVISVTDTLLFVPLPPGTADGDYMLRVESSEKEQIALDLTVDRELSEAEVIAYVDSNSYVPGAHTVDMDTHLYEIDSG